MFNGLIETVGEVVALDEIPEGWRLSVSTSLAPELGLGESVAVNGVCLTVVDTGEDRFDAEVSPETVRVTSIGRLSVGGIVNLERSMRADTRVGGHFVQGHVDATGTVEDIQHEADFHRIVIGFPPSLAALFVLKGSIAVDGISLTVASLERSRFEVQIIPFTWSHTNLSRSRVGDTVNLECDIIGKYVLRALEIGEFQLPERATSSEDQHG